MSQAIDRYLGKNALSRIERNEVIKNNVLTIAQKADELNLEQLPEEIFGLVQDIFKALNEVSGRDIQFEREKLQDQMPRSGVRNRMDDLAVELFGGQPAPRPKKITIVFQIFDLYLLLIKREDYSRRLDNDEYIDSDGDSERYEEATGKLKRLLAIWLGIDPVSFGY
jgi:hypothetical protein